MSDAGLSRREFLVLSGTAGGGLTLAFALSGCTAGPGSRPQAPIGEAELNAWLRIAPSGGITVQLPFSEMGQGVMTAIPLLVAEELDAEWARVRVEPAPVAEIYRNPFLDAQMTGASSSVRESWLPLRRAGATAREMLVAAASARWGVPASECETDQSHVVHHGTSRRLPFGALAEEAAKLRPPREPRLKSPEEFTLIGHDVPRLDLAEKLAGTATYGIDVVLPGMLHAAIRHAPEVGASIESVDDARARSQPGVTDVVQLDDAVAVVAESYWQAQQALASVEIHSARRKDEPRDDEAIFSALRTALSRKGDRLANRGDVDAALATSARVVEAEYQTPLLAHVALEPMNCTASVTPERCEVWVPTQAPEATRHAAATVSGLPEERVHVHTTFLGGGFGRRLEIDFVAQAVEIAKTAGRAVKLLWSREEDMRRDFYRPPAVGRLRGSLDREGRLTGWSHRFAVPSVDARFAGDQFRFGTPQWFDPLDPAPDSGSTPGAADQSYAIPSFRAEIVREEVGVPVGYWRSIGHSFNAFAVESFVDELALEAGADPVAFRLGLLADAPRPRGVLEALAERSCWGQRLPTGRHRGVALHEAFGSAVAQVAEVEAQPGGGLRVVRIVCVVDPGIAVQPDALRAQIEGGIVFGLSATVGEEINVAGGRIVQSNLHDYAVLRLADVPEIEVHIVESGGPPTGVGEAGVPPVAPAVANALFAATGRRPRRLPLGKALLAAS